MSTTPDNSKAYVWQDGDAYRAPAGTALPEDPWAHPLVTGTSPGVTWDAFGGIQAGFNLEPNQDIKKHTIFNKRDSTYALSRGPREDTTKFRAVDYSKAAVLTSLLGGEIVQVGTSEVYKWVGGNAEEFALIWTLADPSNASTDRVGFYTEKATLSSPPPRTFAGEDLDGWEFEILALSPLVPISNWNPLAP
ncbi:hypothetical protein [Gordonia sihwensis]|uniref:Major tail protein n=1 Tax=Gordonia sihwensis NBRC 108236 TaxID=1223544 RepID=L7LH01_9ACTN|nr:hypothetical protein [Gordonia sihwensis]WFN93474.1 hypothetical protein P5P27_02550 [Gordonia sihwensis]GAC59343.1 hypothetical protein GSI01S_01_03100 [Gordonia sihwensis NBRC 108236]